MFGTPDTKDIMLELVLLRNRIVELEAENQALRSAHETAARYEAKPKQNTLPSGRQHFEPNHLTDFCSIRRKLLNYSCPWTSLPSLEGDCFARAFYSNPIAMSITTSDSIHLDVNQAWITLFGHSRKAVIGKTTGELGLWADKDRAWAFHNQLLTQGIIDNFEMSYLNKNGTPGIGLASARVVAMNGEPCWLITVTDIGPLKEIEEKLRKSEQNLRQSEEKFSQAFQFNPDLMAISTLEEGRYVEVNDAFVKLTGYQREEVIGRTVDEMGIWAQPEHREALKRCLLQQKRVQGFELDLKTKSGDIRKLSLSGQIIDIDGKSYLLNVSRDITESQRMMEQLRFSEEIFSLAFEVCPFIMSISTLEEGRYIKVNNAFCTITGYSLEEIIGRTSIELGDIGFWMNPQDREVLKQETADKGSLRDMEFWFRRKNREVRLGRYFSELIDIQGEACLLSVIIDITDLRQMENEMNRLDRLNIVGEMAASIGHEIRNPMTTVRGFLQLMRENDSYSEVYDHFDLMIEELDRANSIVTEFLSLAKDKAVEIENGNINAIVAKLLPLLEAKAVIRDQSVVFDMKPTPDLSLDIKEIRQLILNLVNNGLESMSAGGVLKIKTWFEDGSVVMAVTDQGSGIEQSMLDKLGTPFLTTKEHGSGLGLAVCYRIATRHNARIHIDTTPQGTTFYVKFAI